MHCIPDTISAGLTFRTSLTFSAYSAEDWTATLILRGPSSIDVEGTADGIAHVFHAAGTVTAEWMPGQYQYEVRVTDGTDVFVADAGRLVIAMDLSAVADGHDPRTHAEQALEAIEAILENRASLEQLRYQINNRELWRTPVGELAKLRDKYRAEVVKQKAAANGRPSLLGRLVRVRLN